MNTPFPAEPEPGGSPPDSDVSIHRLDTAEGEPSDRMDVPEPAEPPDAISDDEYEPI